MPLLYNGKYDLVKGDHEYSLDGVLIPSVTKILYHDKVWTIPKKNLEKAALVGTKVHDWIESYINAQMWGYDPDKKPKGFLEENAIKAFQWWVHFKSIKWLSTERTIFSASRWYAGTADALAWIDNRLVLIDFKTSGTIYDEYVSQLWAYGSALEEEGEFCPTHRLIVRLDKRKGIAEEHLSFGYMGKDKWEEKFESFKSAVDNRDRSGDDPDCHKQESQGIESSDSTFHIDQTADNRMETQERNLDSNTGTE